MKSFKEFSRFFSRCFGIEEGLAKKKPRRGSYRKPLVREPLPPKRPPTKLEMHRIACNKKARAFIVSQGRVVLA